MTRALNEILAACFELDKLHAPFLRRSVASMTEKWRVKTEEFIELRRSQGQEPAALAAGYCKFIDTIRHETIFFFRNNRYRYTTFEETNREVYQNREFMEYYMDGLALSLFLWPNHRALFDFFIRTLPTDLRGNYLEIGPGHGYFLSEAIAGSSYDRFVAADVSPHAIAKAREAVAFAGGPEATSKVDYRVGDIFDPNTVDGQFDAIVMGEVLEHVEAPLDLLKRLRALARPGAYIYVTTCTCAPVVDHIYLFRRVAEVEALVEAAGLSVVERLAVGSEGKDVAYCEANALTVNVAFQLSPTDR